ncbi:MAG TPA: hypothetical protein VN238_01260, partial [Solirubrobacteraceae bacterium]|nr:hypothetical protein [Solirubrobacteraceae bacterium]
AHPALRERELVKLEATAAALATALEERGTPAPRARLAAEIAVTVLRVAFDRWVARGERRPYAAVIAEALDEAGALLGPS